MKNNLLLIAGISGILLTACGGSTSEISKADVNTMFRLQLSNREAYVRGEEKRMELKEAEEDRSDPGRQAKGKQLMEAVHLIDKSTAHGISMIASIKEELFRSLGEDMSKGPNSIVSRPYSPKEEVQPAAYYLGTVKSTASTDLIGASTSYGKQLKEYFSTHRKTLCEVVVSSSCTADEKYSIAVPDINNDRNYADLRREFTKATANSHISIDDQEMIIKLYASLTISEETWSEKLPESCSWLTAFGSLTALENQLLVARADALSLLRSRIGGSPYSFNKIIPVVDGPNTVKDGEDFELNVSMAAIDSDRQPIAAVNGAYLKASSDGKAVIAARGREDKKGSGEMVISGTITILDKSGIPRTMPWQKKITVLK